MVDEPGLGNPYFSPFMVAWALLMEATGLDVFVILRMCAIVNLAIFFGGFGRFIRTLSPNRWASVASLAAIFFLWGTGFFYWSGFISFPSLIASMAYPSTFAVGMGFWLWTWLHKLVNDQDSMRQTIIRTSAIIICGGSVLLSHQFTALGICIYAGFYLISRRNRIRRLTVLLLLVIVFAVTCFVLVWPWYSLFGSVGGADGFNDVHEALYEDIVKRYALLLIAIPALLVRFRRNSLDPVVLTVVTCLALFVYGGITGNYFLARIFPPVALFSQIAVGIAVVEWLSRKGAMLPKLYARIACIGILSGVLFQSGFINLISPGVYPQTLDARFGSRMSKGNYEWLTEYVPRGDSVMTANWDARAMAPAYGIFTVMPAWPDPFLGDREDERRQDTRDFFKPGTSLERRRHLMDEYDAKWVIVVQDEAEVLMGDENFVWRAERPYTGVREEDLRKGAQQLFEFMPGGK